MILVSNNKWLVLRKKEFCKYNTKITFQHSSIKLESTQKQNDDNKMKANTRYII